MRINKQNLLQRAHRIGPLTHNLAKRIPQELETTRPTARAPQITKANSTHVQPSSRDPKDITGARPVSSVTGIVNSEAKRANSQESVRNSKNNDGPIDLLAWLPEWNPLIDAATHRNDKIKLRRLAKIGLSVGFTPSSLQPEHFLIVQSHLAAKIRSGNPHSHTQTLRQAFNKVVRENPALTLCQIRSPWKRPVQNKLSLPWEVFPKALRDELDIHFDTVIQLDPKARTRPGRLRPDVCENYKSMLVRALSAAVTAGSVRLEDCTSLATILNPNFLELIFGSLPCSTARSKKQFAFVFRHLARFGREKFPGTVQALDALIAHCQLGQELPADNLRWVLRNISAENLRRYVDTSWQMLHAAETASTWMLKNALGSAAVGLVLSLHLGLKTRDLAAINIDEHITYHPTKAHTLVIHLFGNDRARGPCRLELIGEAVDLVLTFKKLRKIIDPDSTRFRGWLYPTPYGHQRRTSVITNLSRQLRKFGLDGTPDLFGDLIAAILIAHGTAGPAFIAQALGYRSSQAASARYAPLYDSTLRDKHVRRILHQL